MKKEKGIQIKRKKNCCIDNCCSNTSLNDSVNPTKDSNTIKSFKQIGAEGSSILIGLYYKGSAQLKDLKDHGNPMVVYNSAQRLIKRGLVAKNGHGNGPIPGRYYLTDKGRDLVSPFVNYIRNNTPAY